MKKLLYGFILNLQFFTSIPIRMEVEINPKNIDGAIRTFPLLGLFQGGIYAGILYSFLNWTSLSPLAISFVVWLAMIILTGGIHLDGWMDTSDAYFSFRDKERRLEIMKDPRTGAFGVISIIVLLSAKFLFIYEVVLKLEDASYLLILAIPFFGKMLMGTLLLRAPLAKQEGLGYLFQQSKQKATLWLYPVYLIVVLLSTLLVETESFIPILNLFVVTLIIFLYLKQKVLKWFGGITGDVIGASVEGTECSLWLIVWLYHYYGMG